VLYAEQHLGGSVGVRLERRQDAPDKGLKGGDFTRDRGCGSRRPGNGAASFASLKPTRRRAKNFVWPMRCPSNLRVSAQNDTALSGY
jgi:hypothetical protein